MPYTGINIRQLDRVNVNASIRISIMIAFTLFFSSCKRDVTKGDFSLYCLLPKTWSKADILNECACDNSYISESTFAG